MQNPNKIKELSSLVAKKQTVAAWADIAIKEFQKALDKKKIHDTRFLFDSFVRELRSSGGDVQSVLLKFAMYGRFIDMGVGRGVKAYERKSNKANLIAAKRYGANVSYNRRMPRRWYNKTKVAQSLRLQEILIRDLGDEIVSWIDNSFSGQIDINP